MCGRFTLARESAEVAAAFDLGDAPELFPRYNVAPTQPVYTVRLLDGIRTGSLLRWGLVPPWSASPNDGPPLVNARSETVHEKPTFRDAFRKRRCLVPLDGFYEWQAQGRSKVPYHFTLSGGGLFAVAGIWSRWSAPGRDAVESLALLTTEANDLVRPCHDRMPVILPPESWGAWLGGTESVDLRGLLVPFPASAMAARAVGAFVGNVRNEGPRCLESAGPAQAMLF